MTDAEAGYVELHCHSVFSLQDGAGEPESLVARAAALGMHALALTDHDDLGGAVRFAQAAKTAGVGGILGVELTVRVPARTHLVLLAETREGYGNLCTLVTRARLDTPRGDPSVFIQRPISLGLLIMSALLLAAVVLPAVKSTREQAFQE